MLTTSSGSGAVSYASLRTSLIGEGLSGSALDGLIGNAPNEGSAFVRPVSVAGPSVLRFEDDYNGNADNDDVALYFVLNSSNQVVAQGVLGQGDPDVANGLVNVPLSAAGNYKVIFTVNDRNDNDNSSTLDIDRIETQPATINTVSGNVMDDPNDTPSGSSDPAGAVDIPGDGANRVSQVQFGSTIVAVPADGSDVVISGANGVLTINSTGLYTYTSAPGTVATAATEIDAFTYTLRDSDGDIDTAILRIDTTGVADPVAPVAADDRIFTNIGGLITLKDSWLLKNDTDADTAHASLIIASVAAASGQATFFENSTPAHAGTNTTIDLEIGGGSGAIGDGETTSFDYVVADPSLQDTGNAVVKYDTSGSVNGSGNDDILIGLDVGLNGGAGNDQIAGTHQGSAGLLEYQHGLEPRLGRRRRGQRNGRWYRHLRGHRRHHRWVWQEHAHRQHRQQYPRRRRRRRYDEWCRRDRYVQSCERRRRHHQLHVSGDAERGGCREQLRQHRLRRPRHDQPRRRSTDWV